MSTTNRVKQIGNNIGNRTTHWITHNLERIGADVFAWMAVIFLHSATIPSLLAIMTGLSDRMLPVEMVLLLWAGLVMLFARAIIQRDFPQIIAISSGFVLQAVLMALIFFR